MSGMLSSESTGMTSTSSISSSINNSTNAAEMQQQQASSAMSDIINNRMLGCVAHVMFRVRCETLGYGEEVFLIAILDHDKNNEHSSSLLDSGKTVALYTTPTDYPWYEASSSLILSLPPPSPRGGEAGDHNHHTTFRYQYAIYRAGIFHRYESAPVDAPKEILQSYDSTKPFHELPLNLLSNGENYTVNDVLGVTGTHPNIDHVRPKVLSTTNFSVSAESLHSRTNSNVDTAAAFVTLRGGTSTTGGNSGTQTPTKGIGSGTQTPTHGINRKKAVGFAPQPPPYHMSSPNSIGVAGKQSVHLSNTDGLVVVSIFLPVNLKRSEAGQWTADWDYEMLLSMQTHLRVTRIGVVKWRGWHGNMIPSNSNNQSNHTSNDSSIGGSPEMGVPRSERHLVEECLRPFHCVPVWVDPILFGEMYNGFCKGVLWPVLHNVTSVYSHRPDDNTLFGLGVAGSSRQSYDSEQFSEYCMDDVEQGPIHGGRGREAELWGAYNTVNRRFAEVIVQCFNEGDLVWIHGFHLLILPSYLARRIPMAKVGIFLHTPFPSSEIFRTLWCREDLLRGMLNADQVGFHLFEYARHFLTSCRRLLGLNYGMIPDSSGGHTLAIDTNGRNVAVTSIHAGVEPPVLNQILSHSSTLEKASSIRQRVEGKHVCCAIDRLESLKGIPLKLLGLERFLLRCPEWVGKIVLVQIGISAFERGEDYLSTKKEVQRLVDKINNQWPGTVQFQECTESGMGLQQRMALLRAADTVVVTAIRDGLNLLPLEYTIAHQDALTELGRKDGRKRGLCILSEFSSCTRVMRGALHVNPWKISEIANAYHQAVSIGEDERLRRISIASEFVTRVTTQRWALAVMLDLKGVYKNINPVQFSGAGLGLGFRLLAMNTGFTSLDTNVLAKAYTNSKARLFLIDYGGTIVSNDNLDNLTRFKMVKERRAPSTPTERMINALKGLCEDKRNTVFVVSGKERHSLTASLQGIPNLGLAAEHGMFISWPTKHATGTRRWETLVPETDRSWRSLAVSIMEVYTSRTQGSYIEETEMKVLWQYRDADTEFGSLQAKELEDHLSKYLRSFHVDILHGGIEEGGYVEVRPKGVNKGVLAMRVLKRFPEIAQYSMVDFALVLGDDHCDEPMLSVMRQVGRRVTGARRAAQGEDPLPDMPATIQLVDVSSCDKYVSPNLDVFTCTIGKKPSAAANYLHDVDEVQELLDSLVKMSHRELRHFSSADLRSVSNSNEFSAKSRFIQSERPGTSSFFPTADNENTTWLGLPKSMSFGMLHQASEPLQAPETLSSNINEFMEAIDYDGEEDIFF